MRADKVEVSWYAAKSRWMVRIQAGEEVIRRQIKLPQNADEPSLRQAAVNALKDEGYEADASAITVKIAA